MVTDASDSARRWRLILGKESGLNDCLRSGDAGLDGALGALYDAAPGEGSGRGKQRGGLGGSAPFLARWLGDIRSYFPSSVVRVMQKDAIERLNLRQLLLEPETLAATEPDLNLAATLVAMKSLIPARTRDTAREVVRRVAQDLERRLAEPLRQAVAGALARGVRNRRPRLAEMDWPRTIRANLRHYQPELRTVIPETRIGFGRRQAALRDIVVCVDQSGSMAHSVVYSSIFAAVLATMRSVRTSLVAFDTAINDLTPLLADPVEALFGFQLGGGTDIQQALGYCQSLITRPEDTVFVLISDLIEGGDNQPMLRRVSQIVRSGVRMVTLLALQDKGAPCYDHANAAAFAALGAPSFACTPDLFPEMMAAALQKRDLNQWAAARGVALERSAETPAA